MTTVIETLPQTRRGLTVRKTYLLLACLLFSLSSWAETVTPDLANRSLELSGMELFLKQVPVMMDHLLRAQNATTTAEQELLGKASERLKQQINYESLNKQLVEHLLASGRSDYLQQMNSALNSPLAKAMNEKEKQVSSADGRQRLAEYREKVKLNPPRGVRVELLRRLDAASRTSEISVLLREELNTSIVHASKVLTGVSTGAEDSAVNLNTPAQKKMLATSGQQVHSFFLYAYRQVPTPQLEKYVQLYEADATRWFVDQCVTAVKDFFSKQRQTFTEGLN
ncbi:hypothetical protein MIB92_01510 [Aestuariirhabdus sp. Z084]|uniref:hypothetical protein n=1 Tax=Aestuariirhabdus haliotis TaxID=2918751 RepID=UPI00201B3A1C|nr:hypothetical protein [Aestuariirhabdus haliotis]MCL6414315.1 hypothetical protein [Aestuariirhabdus haliotis]MCL6418247.1 hypothetical protein [Aestuariirhabdus haliotis]